MRKLLLGLSAAAAIAAPIALSTSSANAAGTPRCQETYVTSSSTTAEFDTVQPAGAYNQWDNTWKHHYVVTVNPNGTFSGTGSQTGNDGYTVFNNEPETISGSFSDSDDADSISDHATFTATRIGDKIGYTLTDASLGTGNEFTAEIKVNDVPVSTQEAVQFKVSMPAFTTVSVDGVTDFANHGEYVAAMGGGSIAAQKCTGMPLVSNKVK